MALYQKGSIHQTGKELKKAIQNYNELIKLYGTNTDPKLQMPVFLAIHSRKETVIESIVAGISEQDLIELLSDYDKPDLSDPLIVALLQRMGKKICPCPEVLEVAEDICREIQIVSRKAVNS